MLFISRASIVCEKKLSLSDSQHSICLKIPINNFHFNGSETFTFNMEIALFELRVGALDFKMNLLPRLANPAYISQVILNVFVPDWVWMDRIHFSNHSSNHGQWILEMLLLCQSYVPLIIDKPRVALEMDAVYGMIIFQCFG